MNETSSTEQGNILVVDDIPENLTLLIQILQRAGHRVRPVTSGVMALQTARLEPPDLMLLDINMPEMDGYQTCEKFKEDPALAEIPVIFVSAMNATFDKVKAFEVGGLDYITKPFQIEEVIARVTTHLRLKRLNEEIREHNQHLDALVRQRSLELAEANERLHIMDRTKTDFLHLIAHEMRTPLNGLLGVIDLLTDETCEEDEKPELLQMLDISRIRIEQLLDDSLLLATLQVDKGQYKPTSLAMKECFESAREQSLADNTEWDADVRSLPDSNVCVKADKQLLVRALKALLNTAIRCASSQTTIETQLTTLPNQQLQLKIKAQGQTIPDEHITGFFDVFTMAQPVTMGGDLGLEPPLAQRILHLFGGDVILENTTPLGICFTLTMPASQ